MDSLATLYADIGPWGLVIVAAIFILLKGKVTFQYPRESEKKKERS
jgi:hypothetical protein